MGLGDFKYAQEVRDVIRELAKSEMARLRPSDSVGTVTEVMQSQGKCKVQFEPDGEPVNVRMFTLRPLAAGAVVRVSGPTGLRHVAEVIDGPSGMMLRSTNGTRYILSVSNTGQVSAALVS